MPKYQYRGGDQEIGTVTVLTIPPGRLAIAEESSGFFEVGLVSDRRGKCVL
jgi:hypothetical protein